ncbi:hypothetical protein FNJ88_10215 [Chryseobacterium sp. SNU WT5]|nr:hypothetical protein FNJ88_10215 [Chryseobacterium sp. SNU WT5]
MVRKFFLISTLTIMSVATYGQDVKKEAENVKTKMDVFASKTGSITKFVDTKLPNLKATYGSAQTRIRKITNGTTSAFFYQIEKEGKYSSNTASIEYSDLTEILKALKVLKTDVANDVSANPDYMENKFVTVDGFQVGYFISGGKASWYIKLEKYGSDNTLFIDNGDTIETAFTDAKNKIDELKK